MIKGSIQEEDVTIIYAPNIGVPQYVRQMLTGGEYCYYRALVIINILLCPQEIPVCKATNPMHQCVENKTSITALSEFGTHFSQPSSFCRC